MTDLISINNKDLYDAYSLGYVSIDWLALLIRQIDKELKSIQTELMEQGNADSNFDDLNKLIAITNFTADEQLEHFYLIKKRFEDAIKQSKTSSLQRSILSVEGENKTNKKAVEL